MKGRVVGHNFEKGPSRQIGLSWFCGLRGEDLNLKSLWHTTDGRHIKDAKWWQKLTLPLVRWAKNNITFVFMYKKLFMKYWLW
jgi:hypothetical protein